MAGAQPPLDCPSCLVPLADGWNCPECGVRWTLAAALKASATTHRGAAVPVDLRQRSAAARCHYLAARLAEANPDNPLAVSLALEILGGEIKGISDRARQLTAEWDAGAMRGLHSDRQHAWLTSAVELLREVARG